MRDDKLNSMPPRPSADRIPRALLARWFVREVLGVVILGVILFVSAGRIDWPAAWVLLGITLLWVFAMALAIIPRHPDLIAERLGPRKGGKRWDVVILSLFGLATIVKSVIAGLDQRFGWTVDFPPGLQQVSVILLLTGYGLIVWATAANAFFAQTVRIQTERGHKVVTGGPYRMVRHPGYLGTIVTELAAPLLLASWWALLIGIIAAGLFVIRTHFEDRTLQDELEGYQAYTNKTRYRLVPGIW